MIRQTKRGGYMRKGDIIIEEAEKAGRIVEATLKWKRFSYGEYGHPDPRIRNAAGHLDLILSGRKAP